MINQTILPFKLKETKDLITSHAGLKGIRIGDAMVAHEHADWIVNLGNGKAEHVRSLIDKIQEVVFKKFSVMLDREVVYIPDDL